MLIDWIKSMNESFGEQKRKVYWTPQVIIFQYNTIRMMTIYYSIDKLIPTTRISHLYGNDAQITYLIRTKRQKKSMLWSDLISRSFANQKHSIRCIDLCLCVAHINISTKSVYNVQHISISIWCDKKKEETIWMNLLP